MSQSRAEARRALVVRLWKEHPDWTLNRVAKAADVAWVTARDALGRAGIDYRSRASILENRYALIRTRNQRIRSMARERGLSTAKIAKREGITRQRVHYIVSGGGL